MPWSISIFKNNTRFVSSFGKRGLEFLDISEMPKITHISSTNMIKFFHFLILLYFIIDFGLNIPPEDL